MESHGKNGHRDLATGRYACSPSSSLPFPRSLEQWHNEQSLEEIGEMSGPKSARERDAALLASKIDRMCEAIESRSAATSTNKRESTSIKEVMKVVTSLPGAEEGTELWFFTTRLFLNRDKREMFCTIENPDMKLKWLKFEMAEK